MADRAGARESWDATWEGTRRHHLEATLKATAAQRLAWLEEALEIAYRSGALDEVRAELK